MDLLASRARSVGEKCPFDKKVFSLLACDCPSTVYSLVSRDPYYYNHVGFYYYGYLASFGLAPIHLHVDSSYGDHRDSLVSGIDAVILRGGSHGHDLGLGRCRGGLRSSSA